MAVIITFLVLTFGLTWSMWAIVMRAVAAGPAPTPAATWLALGGPVFLVGVFSPGLVALALTARDGGRASVSELLDRIVRWRVDVSFYLFALLLIPVIKLAVAGLVVGLTGAWPPFGETRPVILLGATLLSTFVQAGEEVGWRGYLLPRLAARTNLIVASLAIGIVWAAWHLPLFYAPGADTNGQSFPLYTAQVTAYSVVLTWLYWRTDGSLLLPMLAHAAFNNMKDIVPSAAAPQGESPFTLRATLVLWLAVCLLWTVAAVLLVRMRGATLSGRTVARSTEATS